MLFDLRGRGRRGTVRVIYIGLAVLIGIGLVGFGIGGGVGGGGLFNAAEKNEGSGGASFSGQIKKYQKLTQQQPTNVAAWEQLVRAQLHQAGGEAYTTRTGLTSKGREVYAQVAQSWRGYIALNPPKPSLELAKGMLRVFDEEGLNDTAAAVEVLQIIVAAEPSSAAFYSQLAIYAYKAHNTRIGDLASRKAISLAPVAQRPRLQAELAEVKKNPTGNSNESAVATTNGKTFTVKSAGKGSYTGTLPTTTPSPAAPSKK